jgi:hypothetical protein
MDITRDTFLKSDEETQKAITFDLLQGIHQTMKEIKHGHDSHMTVCDARFVKLEKRKRWDTTISGITGLMGGIVAGWFGGGK